MLFDVQAKEKKEDFYNYSEELGRLKSAIGAGERLMVVKGPRRVGKTSLMKVAFNSLGSPKAWIDARKIFAGVQAESVFYEAFMSILRQIKVEERLLARIESISLGSIGVGIKAPSPSTAAEEAQRELGKRKTRAVIFIDEAQLLKKYDADRFLAYIYDNMKMVQMIVAGSQVGLLEEFVGRSAESPLFGRAKTEIEMKRLDGRKAAEFLKEGFREARVKVPHGEIEEAIRSLDGLIGWLTYYGHYRMAHPHEKALQLVKRDATEITSAEIDAFLALRKGMKARYRMLLKALGQGPLSWEDMKRYLEIKEGKAISDSRMSEYISKLVSYGFVEKANGMYALSDPLMKEALRA